MAKSIRATVASTAPQAFPFDTVATVYRFLLTSTGQSPQSKDVAYGASSITVQFDNLASGVYTVNVSLRGTPDNVVLGTPLTQSITVTPDDILLQVPGLLSLTVINV